MGGMKSWPLARRDAHRGVVEHFGPATFTMRLPTPAELTFTDAHSKQSPLPLAAEQPDKSFERKAMRQFLRVAVVAQSLILCILVTLAVLLLMLGMRASNNLESYYDAALPVITQMTNYTLGMMDHAHSSIASVDRMALHAEAATDTSIPALIESVNRTAAAVTAVTRMASHPVLKLSMEPQIEQRA